MSEREVGTTVGKVDVRTYTRSILRTMHFLIFLLLTSEKEEKRKRETWRCPFRGAGIDILPEWEKKEKRKRRELGDRKS